MAAAGNLDNDELLEQLEPATEREAVSLVTLTAEFELRRVRVRVCVCIWGMGAANRFLYVITFYNVRANIHMHSSSIPVFLYAIGFAQMPVDSVHTCDRT